MDALRITCDAERAATARATAQYIAEHARADALLAEAEYVVRRVVCMCVIKRSGFGSASCSDRSYSRSNSIVRRTRPANRSTLTATPGLTSSRAMRYVREIARAPLTGVSQVPPSQWQQWLLTKVKAVDDEMAANKETERRAKRGLFPTLRAGFGSNY
jgi:hypothetical protein